jgi:hypothetical protein
LPQGESADVAALRLHAALLRALSALRRGDNKTAGPLAEALPPLLRAVQAGGAVSYDWLAAPTLEALVHVVRARVWHGATAYTAFCALCR